MGQLAEGLGDIKLASKLSPEEQCWQVDLTGSLVPARCSGWCMFDGDRLVVTGVSSWWLVVVLFGDDDHQDKTITSELERVEKEVLGKGAPLR